MHWKRCIGKGTHISTSVIIVAIFHSVMHNNGILSLIQLSSTILNIHLYVGVHLQVHLVRFFEGALNDPNKNMEDVTAIKTIKSTIIPIIIIIIQACM